MKQTITSTYTYTYPQPCNPEAYIAVKGNRIKSYFHGGETCVYLDNGTEFQIELFNNSNYKVKAVIEINGKVENNALVLRPNQRYYLDRFMDEQKKLKFDTFMTGNDDIEKLKEIIAKNGRIKISFYKEFVQVPIITWTSSPTIWYDNNFYNNNTGSPPPKYVEIICDAAVAGRGFSDDTSLYSAKSLKCCNRSKVVEKEFVAGINQTENPKEIETGRVEKGEKSNQDFIPTYDNFELFTTAVFEYHIMPASQKPKPQYKAKKVERAKDVIVADDIRTYCPSCGRRVKKGWQFCAGCGHRF